jgi:hypothetical protein
MPFRAALARIHFFSTNFAPAARFFLWNDGKLGVLSARLGTGGATNQEKAVETTEYGKTETGYIGSAHPLGEWCAFCKWFHFRVIRVFRGLNRRF